MELASRAFPETLNWSLLQNSLLVGGLTTLIAGALGFVVALALAGFETRTRRVLLALSVAALMLPPFLVTNCWLDLLGPNGVLHRWCPLRLHSPGGAIGLLTLLTWPVTTLFTLGAWNRLEPSQLESDPALRGTALVRWLLWPMARGAVGSAAVVTFVLVLNNFSVPVILQVPVFPEELWLAFTTRLNDAGARAAAWPLVAAPAILLLALRRTEFTWPRLERGTTSRLLQCQTGPSLRLGARLLAAALLALSVGVPVAQLVSARRTWTELPNLLRAVPEAVWNSAAYAGLAATAAVLVGLGTARWRAGIGLWLVFFAPGMLLGQALLRGFQETAVYGTMTLVVLAFALRYAALGWSGVALALRAADREWFEAARIEGARGWTLFRLAIWPQIAPQVAAAWYAIYLLCLWEVETLVFLQPPGGETLALRAFNMLHYGHTAQVNGLCLLLLALALAPFGGWWVVRRLTRERELVTGH